MIRRKKVMYEEDLHEIFYSYPYLIVNKPDSITKTIHEYQLDSNSIPDIYIETTDKRYYCEVKITKLKEKDLYQALRYLNSLKFSDKKFDKKGFSVILIGMGMSNHLKEKAKKRQIKIMSIGEEISGSIKICKNCRKAFDIKNSNCIYCNSNEIFEIITLLYP